MGTFKMDAKSILEPGQWAEDDNIEAVVETTRQILTILPQETTESAAKKMAQNDIGSLIVINTAGKTVGILSERDIVARVVARGLNPAEVTVRDAMTTPVIICGHETTIAEAHHIMAQNRIRHLPIIHQGRPEGMISSRDILSHQLATVRTLARKQYQVLQTVEEEHPGITKLSKDRSGRIMI